MADDASRWSRLESVVHAARARPVEERAAFLVEACSDDSDLRREAASLLEWYGHADGFLSTPLDVLAANVITSSTDRTPDPAEPRIVPGSRLGAYEIRERLGAGGMGEVYLAHDTKLDRDVAVKVLLPAVANDPERLARFAREARTLASLNHPHIAQIYGIEDADGVRALVMELVDGPTLAERIARGPLPLDEALRIARQIAEALEAAHEQPIVHRDLKPANIKLRSDGTVKVLDFGLAKALDQAVELCEPSAIISTAGMTRPGVLLGTAAYMAPEQVQGRPVDKRADIWAFGCVLFEVLTGRRVFDGETSSHMLVMVLEHEPDWQLLPMKTPAAIRRLLQRCLEKDPKRRLDSAAVARIEIDEALGEPTPAMQGAARRGSLWRPIAWAATGASVAMLVTTMLARRTPQSEPPGPVVSHIRAAGLNLGQPGVHFAVAPNGKTVVLTGNYGGRPVLFRRDLDRVDPEPIPGTQSGSDVFFSHDGRWLGFEKFSRSELWTMSFDIAATPQRLLPNQPLRGGTWGEDDTIVVGRFGSGLWLASAAGGEPRQLTVPAQGERHELPQMLPGGRAVLFTILASTKPPRVAVYLLGSGETRSLFEGVGARFVRSGHVVFGLQGRLWAVGFDPTSLKTVGTARPVRDDVLWSPAGYPQFAVGGSTLAYVRASQKSSDVGKVALTWVDRHGRRDTIPLEPDNFMFYRLSPTGNRVVVQVGASRDLWTYDFTRGTFERLTSDRIIASSAPAWTSDGSRVAFTTWFDGEVGLGMVRADGSGQVEELIKGMGMRSFEGTHPVMLPDGSGLILSGLAPGATAEELLFVPLVGERRVETLFQAGGVERNPALAPSGHFIAYNSDESSRSEVYVRPYPSAGSRRWQISTEGGFGPVWTRGGSEIVYQDGEDRMVAVVVRSDTPGEFDFSKPETLFTIRRVEQPPALGDRNPAMDRGWTERGWMDRGWDVTADGERFLVRHAVVGGAATDLELILIQNWFEELKAKVP